MSKVDGQEDGDTSYAVKKAVQIETHPLSIVDEVIISINQRPTIKVVRIRIFVCV